MRRVSVYSNSWFTRLVVAAFFLSLVLTVVSSLMRLSNQGLGCADWPECYGFVDMARYGKDIGDPGSVSVQSLKYVPARFVERTHRVIASLLQISIIAIVIMALRGRRTGRPITGPLLLLGLSLFLAVVGIWYGSPLLRPPVVIANLLGGMAILGVLWWQCLAMRGEKVTHGLRRPEVIRVWAVCALLIVVVQTGLGGWISSNFASLGCTTLPLCDDVGWSEMKFSEAFTVRSSLDVNAVGQVLIDPAAAAAIQIAHRIGALSVLLVVGSLAYRLMKAGGRLRTIAIAMLIILVAQALLGAAVTIYRSPLALVVTHTVFAAFLWLSMITVIVYLYTGTGNDSKSRSAVALC